MVDETPTQARILRSRANIGGGAQRARQTKCAKRQKDTTGVKPLSEAMGLIAAEPGLEKAASGKRQDVIGWWLRVLVGSIVV
jgi:hypothetical protein